jgi:hypothetical protein
MHFPIDKMLQTIEIEIVHDANVRLSLSADITHTGRLATVTLLCFVTLKDITIDKYVFGAVQGKRYFERTRSGPRCS